MAPFGFSTYVKNQANNQTDNAGGLLLYAKSDEMITHDGMVKIEANWIGEKYLI